jgi:ubiquinone/menaquinone biosynthesis C-methylase UbiE
MNMPVIKDFPESYASRLVTARKYAALIAQSKEYEDFVDLVKAETPWRFKGNTGLDVFLRGVDQHLNHSVPKLLRSVDRDIRTIFEFGCGSGSAAIALAMVFPECTCYGVDISAKDVALANARAQLYRVDDRCSFDVIDEGSALSMPDDRFDLCTCCSVLEYITAPDVRKRCVQEMARVVSRGGLIFVTVPNRISPIEIHTGKWGWNYFPSLFDAHIVGSTAWEVAKLARPHLLKLHRTPLLQLFTPWTSFCLKKADNEVPEQK